MFTLRRRIAAIAVSLLAGTLSVAAPASADPVTGSQNGTVTLSGALTGAPEGYAGGWVTAYVKTEYCDYDACSPSVEWANDTFIDAETGAFSVSVPSGGTYFLLARGDGFIANAYGLAAADTEPDIMAGVSIVVHDEDISGLDIAVTRKPQIQGTITLPAAALAEPGPALSEDGFSLTTVTIYSYETGGDDYGDGSGMPSGWYPLHSHTFQSDELAEQMTFAIPVNPGTYRVGFSNYWTGTKFYGGTSLNDAADITVGAADVTGIDFAPEALPVISGTLTAPAGATLDSMMYVMAVSFATGPDNTPAEGLNDSTIGFVAADGTYRIPTAAGDYVVIAVGDTMFGFYGPEPDCFSSQGFDKGCYPTPLTVDGSGATGVDVQMRWFPRITGTLTIPDGLNVSDVFVSAETWQEPDPSCDPEWDQCGGWSAVATGTVLDNGDGTATYRVPMREPGTYRLVFSGYMVEPLTVGGDFEPNADAVAWNSLTFAEFTRDVKLAMQTQIVGYVNPDILGGGAADAQVTFYAYDEETDSLNYYDSTPVDLDTMTFSAPIAAGDYSALLTWTTYDEFGNPVQHKAFLSGPRVFKANFGEKTSISFDATAPSAPMDPQVTGVGDSAATVGWSAPESDGGSTVTGYTVTAVDVASGEATDATCTAAGDEGSCTVEGLDNLREYTFSVTASNDAGESDAATTGMAVPHEDGFAVWVNHQTSTADGDERVWILGANPTDSVTVKVGADAVDVTPEANGDAMVPYTLDSGSSAVRSGKVKVYAKAVRTTDTGRTKRFNAKTTIYVPKTKVRTIAREGGTVTARVTSAAPDSEVSISIDGEEMCAGSTDRFGRLACTFDSPAAGGYTLTTTVNGVQTATNDITVRAARRI